LVVPTLRENVKQVRIVPRNGYYVIEVIYEVKESEKKKNVRVAAIDLGLNNLVTAVTNDGDNPLIVSGRKIKSINQYFNKAAAKKKSLLPKGIYTSKALDRLWLKRNNTIDHEIHKISKYLVNYFDERDISKVVIGNNTGWKNEISFEVHIGETTIPVKKTIYRSDKEESDVLVKKDLKHILDKLSKIDRTTGMIQAIYGSPSSSSINFSALSPDSVYNMYGNISRDDIATQLSEDQVAKFKESGIALLEQIQNSLESLEKSSDTKFMAVRFGNVLGSNGSVIPIFSTTWNRIIIITPVAIYV